MTVTKIEGMIRHSGGQGFARQNYKVMIPEIAKEFPSVKNCGNYGTINVDRLNPPLRKSFADFWTARIRWEPVAGDLGHVRHEKFGLIKIRFECLPSLQYDAWIVLPEGHSYSYNENGGVEIVSETLIPEVNRGAACALYIDHKPEIPRPDDFGAISIEVYPLDQRSLIENSASVPR